MSWWKREHMSRTQYVSQTEDTEEGGKSADWIAQEGASVRYFHLEVNNTHIQCQTCFKDKDPHWLWKSRGMAGLRAD